MIIRIVKMTISPNKVKEFKSVFEKHMELIRGFEGCKHLELLQEDNIKDNVLMTYSYWNSHQDLEKYRKSDLFKKVWASVKPMFSEKPLAWSLKQQFKL
jgi:quinol monooxygenase YgiN